MKSQMAEQTRAETLPFAAVIPTRNRVETLQRTLDSLMAQSVQPARLIIIDASDNAFTQALCSELRGIAPASNLVCVAADTPGAASQRNQGVRICSEPVIGFFDDDIQLEPFCIERLWRALHSNPQLGGVNATITNQRYSAPGRISQLIFRAMAGRKEASYSGRVLGPAINLLPEDRDDLPDVVPVEWLNTTCVLYRREALPDPPFPSHFTGYSLMEDVALSVTVGKRWGLANARTARIYHDSQPGTHKSDPSRRAEMQLVNRHYVMTKVLGRNSAKDYMKLILFDLFSLSSSLGTASGRAVFGAELRGRLAAIRRIVTY